jgi:hypothetical protein
VTQQTEHSDDIGPEVIQDIFQVMNIDAQWSTRETRSFEWWGYRLRQRVWAEPVNVSRGAPIVRFHAETDYIKDVPDREQTYAALGAMNDDVPVPGQSLDGQVA